MKKTMRNYSFCKICRHEDIESGSINKLSGKCTLFHRLYRLTYSKYKTMLSLCDSDRL